nr:MAG TPA: Selenoprotein S (SelS) [Caudoviricetes sp.]
MKTLKEITEALQDSGVENASELAESIKPQIDEAINAARSELQEQYDLKLAETVTTQQELAESKAEEKLKALEEELIQWHEQTLTEEVAQVSNQLQVAQEIRTIRAGMEKVVEGLRDIGIDATQLMESAAAAEVVQLQEEVATLRNELELSDYETKKFQRAFVVSEATRTLSDFTRERVINAANNLSEEIELPRFSALVEAIVTQEFLNEGRNLKEDDEDNADNDSSSDDSMKDDEPLNEKDKKKKKVNESYGINAKIPAATAPSFADIFGGRR